MIYIQFTLTMPGRASWNGRWSGEDRFYAKVRKFHQRQLETVVQILRIVPYYYHWDDGWTACISVKQISGEESRIVHRKSNGFCGYEWMIDSIINHGEILADHQVRAKQAVEAK